MNSCVAAIGELGESTTIRSIYELTSQFDVVFNTLKQIETNKRNYGIS